MSMIPYTAREGREIVLRHRNAIVVRDAGSRQFDVRGLDECPTCHQPWGHTSTDSAYERPFESDSYVNPNYFRMLRDAHSEEHPNRNPPSPVRRFFQPALAGASSQTTTSPGPAIDGDAEFVSSTPGVAQSEGSRIRQEAFSPSYFSRFFVEEKVLGKGGKGVVLLVRHEIDGCHLGHFACKRVPVGNDHAWLEKVLIEVELLAKLSHPNLVSYRHVWLEDMRLTRFGPSVICAFILQQYCNGGDLHQYVLGGAPREATKEELKAKVRVRRQSKGQTETQTFPTKAPLSFEEIFSLFKDITSGVAYLHAANYIHRDLKPSNCLLHRESNILSCMISDFGEVQPENAVRKSSGSTGTISYCAPEVLKTDATGRYGNFTTKSDIFSLGMILYFMCFGRLPYRSANAIQEELEDIDALRAEISQWRGFQEERRQRPDLPPKVYTLLRKLLALKPAERPNATEILAAMNSEANFEGFARDRSSSPPVDLRGSRVQSLDSPASPSTPVPASRRRSHRSRPVSMGDASPSDGSPIMDGSPPPRRPLRRRTSSSSAVMTLSRNQLTYHEPSMSPGASDLSKDDGEREDLLSPRLLLPPPRTGLAALQYRLVITFFRLASFLGLDQGQVSYLARLGLFFVKLTTLVRPCWPYMSNLGVAVPLIFVAALDLGLPGGPGPSSLTRRRSQPKYGLKVARAWGLGTSLILLLLHLLVLWLAGRWSALCVAAPHHERWSHWDTEPLEPLEL